MKTFIGSLLLIVIFSSCQQEPSYKEFHWQPYSQQAVEESVTHKKPVVIDFWAEWCPNCHELDRTVFSRPDVQEKLSRITALRMDVTDQDNPEVQKIIEKYDIEGVPTVIFLNSQGKEIENARIIGLATPDEFSESLALLNIFK